MIHLLLDEIYSVNVYGLRLKKSAGSAFKFFERKKPVQYACLYALLAAVVYVAPPYGDLWRSLVRTTRQLVS